jgi:hypothetical protein
MVLQDCEGSVERRLERLFRVVACCLKVPTEQSLNDPLPMPLHVGTYRSHENGIERFLKQRLKRLLRFLLQFAAGRMTEKGLETGLER